ncbi:MAG: SLBB domain-containing protein [candidate division WOR-3 bacterium]
MRKEKIMIIFNFILFSLISFGQTIDKNLLEKLTPKKTITPQPIQKDTIREKRLIKIPEAETLSTIEKMFNEKYFVTSQKEKLQKLRDSLIEEVKTESLKIEMRGKYLKDVNEKSIDKYLKYIISADTTYFGLRKKLLKVNKKLDSISPNLKQFGYDMFEAYLLEPPIFAPIADNYILGPGDELYIEISGKDLNTSFTKNIDRNGELVLPYVGSLNLWGISYGESKKIIEEAFKKEFTNIEVNVSLGNLKSVSVFVLGEVNNPGIYNISVLSNPLSPLFEAEGVKKSGSLRKIKYISENGNKNIDLYKLFVEGQSLPLIQFSSGDIIYVPPIGSVVGIKGAVNKPGIYELEGKEYLEDIIKMAGGFSPIAGRKRIQIERISSKDEKFLEDLNFENVNDFQKISKTFKIENGDLISVFEIFPYYHNYVEIYGDVKKEGIYEFKKGMTILKLIEEAGGPKSKGTTLEEAELIRFISPGEPEKIMRINLKDPVEGNIELKEYDKLKVLSKERKESYVYLDGEFLYPGKYQIKDGVTTIKEVIERAGGFTENAYPEGTIFIKKALEESQKEALENLKIETHSDLILQQREVLGNFEPEIATAAQEYIKFGEELLPELKKIQIPGRVIINLLDTLQLKTPLEDGDRIEVPKIPKIVQIIGEVYNPTGIIYKERFSLKDYLNIAGGLKPSANKKEIYVRRASGKILKGSPEIKPGDTIVVPAKVKIETGFWKTIGNVADVLYKVAIAVLAYATLSSSK